MQIIVKMLRGKARTLHLCARMQILVKILTGKADTLHLILVKMLTGKADTLHQGGRLQIRAKMLRVKSDTLRLGGRFHILVQLAGKARALRTPAWDEAPALRQWPRRRWHQAPVRRPKPMR